MNRKFFSLEIEYENFGCVLVNSVGISFLLNQQSFMHFAAAFEDWGHNESFLSLGENTGAQRLSRMIVG